MSAERKRNGMNTSQRPLHRQSGVALVVLLALLLMVSAAILLDRLGGEASASVERDNKSGHALANAKAALIAWSATYSPSAARQTAPGTLPYPDLNVDGTYDGFSDCDALGANQSVVVGRFPQRGEHASSPVACGVDNALSTDLRDGAGEPLWYAVSRNLLPTPGGPGGPINPDMGGSGRMQYPWIQLRDEQGNVINDPSTGAPLAVAAVIFAPGAPVGTQDRAGAAAASNYLDSVTILGTTYDNADVDGCPDSLTAPCAGSEVEEFIVYPNPGASDVFNDKLVYITVDELMRAVEKRVIGELAVILRGYRGNYGAYPWLADYRNPRKLSSGSVDAGSSTHLDHAAANFLADGARIGDIAVNLSDGSSGPITNVTATRIDVEALQGGTENDFDAGENFEIRSAFNTKTVPPFVRHGQLPVHLPDQILFNTGFTATWDFDDIDDYYESGDSALWADNSEFRLNNASYVYPDGSVHGVFDVTEGICMWTHRDRVDCYGIQVIGDGVTTFTVPSGHTVTRRTVEVQFSFEASVDATSTSAAISPPSATAPRTRSVTIRTTCSKPRPWNNCQDDVPSTENGPPLPDPSRFGAATPPELAPAPFLPRDRDATPGDDETWIVRITDENGANVGQRAVVIDHDTRGEMKLSGIRYDLGVAYDDTDNAQDELPEWFVENNWHHFIYAAIAPDFMAGGDSDCVGSSSCLTINVAGTAMNPNPNVRALLIASGSEWNGQNRDTGDCNGDALINAADDDILCAYFDSDTTLYPLNVDGFRHGADTAVLTQPMVPNDQYSANVFGAEFNDQVRIIEP